MKNKIIAPALLLLISSGIVACSADRQVAANVPETVHDVSVTRVQELAVPDTFPAMGTVHALRTAPLSAQVMGYITAVNVREGDAVKAGQVLATIDDTQTRAAVAQARAAVAAAEHEASASESEFGLAQSTFNRMQVLYSKKSLSPQEYDEIKTRLQSAGARRDTSRASQAEAAAALEQAQATLDHTRVRAPFAGVITERRVDPGALASPGMQLLTVEATGRFRLEASVDEHDLKFVRLGGRVPVTIDAFDGAPLSGKVAQIVPAADPSSRSFLVKIDLPANTGLRSGLFGRAAFARGMKQAILVPAGSVMDRGQLQSVYVVGENNIAGLRYVTLGNKGKDMVEVLSGLSPGEMVVASPAGRELAGKRIEVR